MKEMKKFLLMLLVAAVPMGMIACSDDDDDPKDKTLAEEVAGTYTCTFELTGLPSEESRATEGGGGAAETNTIDITLTEVTDQTINLSFGDIKLGGVKVATIETLKDIKLSGTNANVTIASTTFEEAAVNVLALGDIKAKIILSGSVKEGKDLALTASVAVEDPELTLNINNVKGTKK